MNLYAEYSLHAQLKEALSGPGDRFEVVVNGKVVDLVRADGELVEVQTRNLGAIVPKVLALAAAGGGRSTSGPERLRAGTAALGARLR